MQKPIVSYHVLDVNNEYVKRDSVYAGTYTGDDNIYVHLRIWNNFQGTEDVDTLHNFNLVLRFLTEEDNALLKYITLSDDTHNMEIPTKVEQSALIGTFFEDVSLSGQANTGSNQYKDNYVDILVTFSAPYDAYLKDHDLKSLVLEIVEK